MEFQRLAPALPSSQPAPAFPNVRHATLLLLLLLFAFGCWHVGNHVWLWHWQRWGYGGDMENLAEEEKEAPSPLGRWLHTHTWWLWALTLAPNYNYNYNYNYLVVLQALKKCKFLHFMFIYFVQLVWRALNEIWLGLSTSPLTDKGLFVFTALIPSGYREREGEPGAVNIWQFTFDCRQPMNISKLLKRRRWKWG